MNWATILAAASLAVASPAPPPDPVPVCLIGEYDGGQQEVAAGLQLAANGEFRYALAYGALDEGAAGTWRADARAVYLTSGPVSLPRFSVASDEGNADKLLRITLDLPSGLSSQYFAAVINYADGRRSGRQFTEDAIEVPIETADRPVSVTVLLPVFDLASDPLPLAGEGGRDVTVKFEPNNLGAVVFKDSELVREEEGLRFYRHGREIHFRQTSGPCFGKAGN